MPADRRKRSTSQVVIAGGGVAALEAALALRQLAGDRVKLTLLAPAEEFVYKPLAVLEPFAGRPPRGVLLATFAAGIGASVVKDSVASVDPERKVVLTGGERTLSYDALLIAIGARTGAAVPGTAVVDMAHVSDTVFTLIEGVRDGTVRSLCLVASERTWPLPVYELALLLHERLREPSPESEIAHGAELEMTIVTAERAPLAVFGDAVSEAVAQLLADADIQTIAGSEIESAGGNLTLQPSGAPARFDRLISMPELKGPAIPGLPADAGGFLPITADCAVLGVDRVYAAGDATDFPVKFGGIAAQQADTAAAAIAAIAGAPTEALPFDGTVHGALQRSWTPMERLYFTAQVQRGEVRQSRISGAPTSSPAAKIAARYLGPYLDTQWTTGAGWLADRLSWEAAAERRSEQSSEPQPTG